MSHNNNQISQDVFVIARRHASWAVAGVIALVVCAFVVGYVSGKRAGRHAQNMRNELLDHGI